MFRPHTCRHMAPAQKTSEMGADVDGIDNEDYSLATCDACGISVRGKSVFALPSGRTLVYLRTPRPQVRRRRPFYGRPHRRAHTDLKHLYIRLYSAIRCKGTNRTSGGAGKVRKWEARGVGVVTGSGNLAAN